MSSKSDRNTVGKPAKTWFAHTCHVANKAVTKNSKWPDKVSILILCLIKCLRKIPQ